MKQAAGSRLRTLAGKLPEIGSLLLLIVYGIAKVSGDSVPGMALVENLAHLYAIPGSVILILAWRRRSRMLGIAGFLCILAGVVEWNRVSPSPIVRKLTLGGKSASTHSMVRVMSWNAGTGRASADEMLNLIKTVDAGIVAMVEVPEDFEQRVRGGGDTTEMTSEQPGAKPVASQVLSGDLLQKNVLPQFPWRIYYGEGLLRKAVLSSYPIRMASARSIAGSRDWLELNLYIFGETVSLGVVHPSPWVAILGRHCADGAALDEVARRASLRERAIVCGDMNSTDRSSVWSRLGASGLHRDNVITVELDPRGVVGTWDTSKELNQFTFPLFGRYHGIPVPPIVRIDAIWTRGFSVVKYETGPDGGSDHLPVIAEIIFQ